MKVAKQLSVMLPNKPGQLAALCRKLAAARVNIRAIAVVETTEQGIARMVVDKTAAALKVVKAAKLGHVVAEVVLVEMMNKPGVLGRICTILGDHRVSIASCIQKEEHESKPVHVVLMTHETVESSLFDALSEIDRLEFIHGHSHAIRVLRE